MSLEVFHNLSDDVIMFESKHKFEKYYDKHREEIDGMKTRGLNVKYKIDGFTLGRKKGNLLFIPKKEVVEETRDDVLIELQEQLNEIKNMLSHIMKHMATK